MPLRRTRIVDKARDCVTWPARIDGVNSLPQLRTDMGLGNHRKFRREKSGMHGSGFRCPCTSFLPLCSPPAAESFDIGQTQPYISDAQNHTMMPESSPELVGSDGNRFDIHVVAAVSAKRGREYRVRPNLLGLAKPASMPRKAGDLAPLARLRQRYANAERTGFPSVIR
jgi:hypothetical protein